MFERLKRWFRPEPTAPKPPPRRVFSQDPAVTGEIVRLWDEMCADPSRQLPVFKFWMYCGDKLPDLTKGRWRFVFKRNDSWVPPHFEEIQD